MSTSTPRPELQMGREEDSSFSSLSSPMSSPPASPSAQLSTENSYAQINKIPNLDGQHDFTARSITAQANNTQPQAAPARKKPGRKPKPVDPNDPVAVKKAQRNAARTAKRQSAKEAERLNNPQPPPQPRKKKISIANNDQDGGSSGANNNSRSSLGGVQQTKITDMGIRPSSEFKPEVPVLKSNDHTLPSQNGKSEDIPMTSTNFPTQQPITRPLIHRSPSGQNYDPIRSNYDPVRETVINHNPTFTNSQTSPIPLQAGINRASASPSISSLVDPPNHVPQSPSHQSFFNQQVRLQHHESQQSIPPSPTHSRLAPSPMMHASKSPHPPAVIQAAETTSTTTVSGTKKQAPNASTTSSSTAHSPKPLKNKDPLPPPLPGSGGMFGGMGGPANDGTEFRAPTVILHIPMNGDTNKVINFTKLAEERYGWDALHPRLAAQRDRLARVAAAGAALEKNGIGKESGDEMSLDLSEGEGSNAEMGGMSDGRTGTDGGGKKPVRKRKSKEDEYDKDDGFVDDSDLLWEQQAAASRDGFFVYSGPLIPEVERPINERGGDGAQKRGRGRGRGGNSRATAGAARASTASTAAPASATAIRGGGITRKPRITKAAREQMQFEKQERERMGMATTFAPNNIQLASSRADNPGGTQMVFTS